MDLTFQGAHPAALNVRMYARAVFCASHPHYLSDMLMPQHVSLRVVCTFALSFS